MEQEGIVLDENQVAALEKAKEEKQAHGEIETYYPGFLVAQDTYYVGYIKGVGHIYQQTVINTYSKIGFAKLYDRKNAHRLSTQRLAICYNGRFPSTRLRTVHTGLPVHGSPPYHSV